MPTYEYQCKKCNHKFEAFQKMTDTPLKECPLCRGPVKRLIGSGAGIIFKGPGFYATDYRKKDTGASCPASGSNEACKDCPKGKDVK